MAETSNPFSIKFDEFVTSPKDIRHHLTGEVTNVYIKRSNYPYIVIEFMFRHRNVIPDIGNIYNLFLPSKADANRKPWLYETLFKSAANSFNYSEEGEVDIRDLIGSCFCITLERAIYCADVNYRVYYKLINLISI